MRFGGMEAEGRYDADYIEFYYFEYTEQHCELIYCSDGINATINYALHLSNRRIFLQATNAFKPFIVITQYGFCCCCCSDWNDAKFNLSSFFSQYEL